MEARALRARPLWAPSCMESRSSLRPTSEARVGNGEEEIAGPVRHRDGLGLANILSSADVSPPRGSQDDLSIDGDDMPGTLECNVQNFAPDFHSKRSVASSVSQMEEAPDLHSSWPERCLFCFC